MNAAMEPRDARDAPRPDVAPERRRVPASRIVIWVAIGLGILAGVVLYFTYAGDVTPLFGDRAGR